MHVVVVVVVERPGLGLALVADRVGDLQGDLSGDLSEGGVVAVAGGGLDVVQQTKEQVAGVEVREGGEGGFFPLQGKGVLRGSPPSEKTWALSVTKTILK